MISVFRKLIPVFILLLIFGFSLFFRIFFVYSNVISEPVKYSADDGVYHMRLVENELLGGHFPKRINFDPYVFFPYGAYHNVAPLYDQSLSAIIWLVSLGKPTEELINKIAPLYPPFLGSFLVIIVYFLGKKIWGNKRIALFCSFIMAISAPFFNRSLLGDTDHHILEAFFSSLVMLFLFFALKARNNKNDYKKDVFLFFSLDWIKKEIIQEKKFWMFILISVFFLWLYFLTWNGALLFVFIIFLFIISCYLIKFFLDEDSNWILATGIIIFLITLIAVIPFSNNYAKRLNIYYLSSIISGILAFIFLYISGYFIKKRNLKRWVILPFLFIFGLIFILILNYIFPLIFNALFENFQALNNSFNSDNFFKEITSEMRPLGFEAFNFFHYIFIYFLIAFIIVFYKFVKKRKPEDLLIIIWALSLALVCGIIPYFGQIRFIYYFSIVISLMSGFLIAEGLKFGWQGIRLSYDFFQNNLVKNYILIGSLVIIFAIVFSFFYPFPLNIGNAFPGNMPIIFQSFLNYAKNGLVIKTDDWYETLEWMKKNTPDPGVDYYSLYENPKTIDEKTGKTIYLYPDSAYGVLARWDVGHLITYYSHRIPNANNFQYGAGVKKGDKVIEAGEAVFFLENEEEKAIKYLDELKTRYIITDSDSAIPEGIFATKIMILQGDLEGYLESDDSTESPSKFDNSMVARLHILDGRKTTTKRKIDDKEISFDIKPLNYFRLVYESETTVSFSSQDLDNEIKSVKIFEYVKGARIIGKAKSGEKVSISTEITTNQGRKFIYDKSVQSENGRFEFIVPYSTFEKDGWLENQTKFEVFASPYKIKIGEREIEINISEMDVLEGREVEIK